jgi:hypothetical protein
MTHFVPPALNSTAFTCPSCNAYANQLWFSVLKSAGHGVTRVEPLSLAQCAHCGEYTVWKDGKLIYPESTMAPLPNPDLPDEIANDYNEAASIISRSPRGAASLLRLCIQKLCKHLGESGKNINNDIAALVKKGLNPKIQKSLDVVRVIGNEAVHPGTLDMRDKPETAVRLCTLINIIADAMITQPKMIDAIYEELPESKRKEIEKRDST